MHSAFVILPLLCPGFYPVWVFKLAADLGTLCWQIADKDGREA